MIIMNDKLNKLLENRIYNHEKCVAEIEKIADAQSIDFAKWCVNTQAFGAYTYEDALEIFKTQVKLLQPKDYKSKIKLYCRDSAFNIEKFGSLENKSYICRIKIEEL